MAGDRRTGAIATRSPRVTGAEKGGVALLGLNAWVVVFLVPTLHLAHVGVGPWLLALSALGLLAVGVGALGPRPDLARVALLAVFPPTLGLSIAASPELLEREIFDPVTVLLCAASLLAFVALAARSCARAEELKASTSYPSAGREPVAEPPPRRWMRRALLAITAAGGFAIVGIAPIWTSRTERTALWGEARDDGAVLAIVVASVTAAFVIGAIVGPGLRAERRPRKPDRFARRRLALTLVVAGIAFAGWLILRQLDGPA